jgi:AmiR/NasT family two-component response regulator
MQEDGLSALDILLVLPREGDGAVLVRELQRTRARVHQLWPAPALLPAEADVIFCELLPGLPTRLPWNPGTPAAALVAVIPPGAPPDLELLRQAAPEAVLHRPITPQAVPVALALARSRFAYEQRLRGRIDKLDDTLRAMRTVERAKSILGATRNMDEDAAYRFLRSQAMQRRVSIGTVAARIVDSHEMLG